MPWLRPSTRVAIRWMLQRHRWATFNHAARKTDEEALNGPRLRVGRWLSFATDDLKVLKSIDVMGVLNRNRMLVFYWVLSPSQCTGRGPVCEPHRPQHHLLFSPLVLQETGTGARYHFHGGWKHAAVGWQDLLQLVPSIHSFIQHPDVWPASMVFSTGLGNRWTWHRNGSRWSPGIRGCGQCVYADTVHMFLFIESVYIWDWFIEQWCQKTDIYLERFYLCRVIFETRRGKLHHIWTGRPLSSGPASAPRLLKPKLSALQASVYFGLTVRNGGLYC